MGMKKGENLNHPKKGSAIKVEPIRRKADIQTMKNLLKGRPRDYALFVLGINTNLRAGDMLGIKASQIRGKKAGDEIEIKEQKTGKQRRITLNKTTSDALSRLLSYQDHLDEDYLFIGQRGPLTVPSLSRLVKQWCKQINLKGNYAAHSLRKTWGYHQRVTFNVGIPELMVCFNHSTQRQTLDYLCVQPDEIRSIYENEI